jgi:hypothetical protein
MERFMNLHCVAIALALLFFSAPAVAQTMVPTIYSDGQSCPGNCDAHVVFHRLHNGTSAASAPESARANPAKCEAGKPCRICFSRGDDSCLNVTYRGGGPSQGRFDFTPAFFESHCSLSALPAALKTMCASFQRQLDRLTRDSVYCLANTGHAGCQPIIDRAKGLQDADQADWKECRDIGEARFNRKHASEPKRQRSLACAYEKIGTGGPNSNGDRWRRLLPAACLPGTFVGRDGLDCCDSNLMSLGGLGRECTPYLAAK